MKIKSTIYDSMNFAAGYVWVMLLEVVSFLHKSITYDSFRRIKQFKEKLLSLQLYSQANSCKTLVKLATLFATNFCELIIRAS